MSASDSEEDIPLAQVLEAKKKQAASAAKANGSTAKKAAARPRKAQPAKRQREDDDEDEDGDSSSSSSEEDGSDEDRPRKRASKSPGRAKSDTKRSKRESGPKSGKKDGQIMWNTLKHCGVLFPPEYEPHGVKMLYDGEPVDLTPDQEEVATMYAVMLETDYMQKPVFNNNFWKGFKEILGKNHKIQSLEKCNFRPIYEHLMADREKKKTMTKEDKERIKKEKDAAEAKYKIAYVDGRAEPVGNFRVEPPGLFRGRGEHPRMGMIKRRVYPKDITVNIGKGEPLPEHPYPGQTWAEVRHDQTVTWLAYWRDTISSKDYKYVFLGATSTFKADSDLAKYEKARKLKEIIHEVRKNYEKDLISSETRKRQMGVALYFIDKLALRAGHEKDEDEADTVGCCTLKVENIECLPVELKDEYKEGGKEHKKGTTYSVKSTPDAYVHPIRFDFLGKDSIRYENTVPVDHRVYAAVEKFRKIDQHGKPKDPGDQLFETFDAQDLNKELKNIMEGLSVKVFRTYNASIVLERLLLEKEEELKSSRANSQTVDEKKADYDKANKEVAILCNHQRSVPKTHENQMEKLNEKMTTLQKELRDLEDELRAAKKDNKASIQNKVDKKLAQISKMELQKSVKEDLKTVALGTSKINYMDPRITVAWCKRNEVPIDKIFNKSLLAKFNWCMDVEPSFRF